MVYCINYKRSNQTFSVETSLSTLFFREETMKKLLVAVLCLMLTGCTSGPAGSSEETRSTEPSASEPSPAPSDGEVAPSQISPQPDQSTEQEPSVSQEPAEVPLGPQNQEQIIQELLSAMTLEEKVGQMFFVRCPETGGAELAAQYKVGGYLLFGRDFKDKTAQQVRDDIRNYQDASGIPLLIGTDEEGGTVVRASSNPDLFPQREPAPQTLFVQGGMDLILQDARQKSMTLLDLGVNVNFAPVADVSTDPADFIYARSFGQDAQATADYVAQVAGVMGEEHIGSVLKHFPGYGNNVDTHTGIALDQRPYETFQTSDFLPFQAGIQAGADAVLVSHNIVASMDESLPASLSPTVHQILREALDFDGVVLTDDLAMDAVMEYAQDGAAAVLAVQAGNDMVVTTDFQTQIPQVIRAVQSGVIAESQIDQAVTRVLNWKYELGLLGN